MTETRHSRHGMLKGKTWAEHNSNGYTKISSNIYEDIAFTPFSIFLRRWPWLLTFWSQNLISISTNPNTSWHQNLVKLQSLICELWCPDKTASVTKIGWNFLSFCSQGFRVIACCDLDLWPFDPKIIIYQQIKSISTSMNQNTTVTEIGLNSLQWFWDMVFTMFSGCIDSRTHSLIDEQTRLRHASDTVFQRCRGIKISPSSIDWKQVEFWKYNNILQVKRAMTLSMPNFKRI